MSSINRDLEQMQGAQEMKMTKTESIDLAIECAAGCLDSILEVGTDEQKAGLIKALEANIKEEATNRACVILTDLKAKGSRLNGPAFVQQFAKSFTQRVENLFNNLPDVKAENRRTAFHWTLESMIRSAKEDVTAFAAKFAENPCSAFEWADGAMEAAAKLDVATRIKSVFEAEGREVAVNVAQIEALRGARYPSHSTSQAANAMAQYKTAAYAEFAGRIEVL